MFDAWHYDGDITDFEYTESISKGQVPDQFLVTDFSLLKTGLTEINIQKCDEFETTQKGFDGRLSTQVHLIEQRV